MVVHLVPIFSMGEWMVLDNIYICQKYNNYHVTYLFLYNYFKGLNLLIRHIVYIRLHLSIYDHLLLLQRHLINQLLMVHHNCIDSLEQNHKTNNRYPNPNAVSHLPEGMSTIINITNFLIIFFTSNIYEVEDFIRFMRIHFCVYIHSYVFVPIILLTSSFTPFKFFFYEEQIF